MKFSISFKYSNVTFKNKETKETIAYDTKASEGNTFTFDNVDEDVVIGMLKGIKDKKASQLFAYDDLRTNFINVMARNKCKELYDKLDKAEWKIEDIAVSNITIKDVEFTKPTMNAREAITVESKLKQNVDFKELSHIKDSDDLHNLEKVVSKAIKDIDETGFMAKDEKVRKRLHNIRMNLITALPEKKLVRDKYATMESKKMKMMESEEPLSTQELKVQLGEFIENKVKRTHPIWADLADVYEKYFGDLPYIRKWKDDVDRRQRELKKESALPKQPVIFKKDRKMGEVLAFFPDTINDGSCNPGNIMCYAHNGQHGEASIDYFHECRPCSEEEYAELLTELEGIYDDCELVVKRRASFR